MEQEGGKGSSDKVINAKSGFNAAAAHEPSPTCKALQTCLLSKKHIVDMVDPTARQLEMVLASFGCMTQVHEMRSMEVVKSLIFSLVDSTSMVHNFATKLLVDAS